MIEQIPELGEIRGLRCFSSAKHCFNGFSVDNNMWARTMVGLRLIPHWQCTYSDVNDKWTHILGGYSNMITTDIHSPIQQNYA